MKKLINYSKFYSAILSFMAVFSAANSYAVLDIEITQGVDTAVPIAIFPLDVNFEQKSAKIDIIAQVVSSDLARSGLFVPKLHPTPLNSSSLLSLPLSLLKKQQAEYVVKGKINTDSSGRYDVSVELVSVYQLTDAVNAKEVVTNESDSGNTSLEHAQPNFVKAILLSKSYNVTGEQLRSLAHHISDVIYERLTGIKGVFSSKIAYVNVITQRDAKREYTLEVADSDGYNPHRLVISSEPIMSPSWSPNGKEIAYVSFLGNRSKIKIVELATGKSRVVTNYKGINGAPAWSPDGSKLALVLSNEKEPNIFILNLANNKLTQVTNSPSIDTEPRWSPAGESLIFTSNRGGGPQIYQYNVADGKTQRLTYDGTYNARGSFTPDGKKLVMLHRNSKRDAYQIAVQDLSTDNVDILTNSTMDESPSVSANGQQIIYATKDGSRGILAEVSIDGRVKIKRPAQVGDVQEPAWSPYLT